MPPPSEFLLYLNGGGYPSIINCDCGKDKSSFVFATIRMSLLSPNILDHILNLFLVKLMFKCPIKTLLALLVQTFFKVSKGSYSQLLNVISKVLDTSIFEDSVGFILELLLR